MIISLLLFFCISLLIDNNLLNKNIIFTNSIDFSYIRSKANILFGNLINKDDIYVSSEKIIYKDITPYKNGYLLTVDKNYVIKSLKNGVVIFIGDKEEFGTTVIINCDDGTNISYSSLENISVNLYDYINKDTILGSTIDNKLYLEFIRDKEYISYEEYI